MHQLIDKKNRIITYLILLILLSTTSSKFTKGQNVYSFKINRINVVGLSKVNNLKIFNELGYLLYQNILIVRKNEIKKVLNKHNIIEEYNVKKIYPSTININIKPTKLIARIFNDKQLLIGANGKLIDNEENKEILPYMFGEFNSEEFLVFKKNIEKSKFTFSEFETLYFFPSNRWDILTNEGVLIKLPRGKLLESLNFAYKIITSSDFNNKKSIDLRVNNHLIIK